MNCHSSNHHKVDSSFLEDLEETAMKVKIAINPISQNTMEAIFKPRAMRPNVRADEMSPLLSASLAYKQIDTLLSPR